MAHGNVTVPALAFARPVAKPEIKEVLDLDTGEFVDAVSLIGGQRYQALIDGRGKIVERMTSDRPQYACSMCGVPVYLVSTSEKCFFFRHRVEDGSCPACTRSPLSFEEICALKYHGLRESEPHIRIKGLIEKSLLADSSFAEVALERTWRGTADAKQYRRPDVQAVRAGQKLAIEVQLSTTFLSVVVGRRMFYRAEGALLAWVFGGFDPSYRRLTTDDLLFSNNSNVFVIDDETADRSVKEGRFLLRCHYRRPVRNSNEVADEWVEEIVPFAELTQDLEGQRLFLFDYEAAERDLRARIAREAIEREEKRERELRDAFSSFWCGKGSYMSWTPDNLAEWSRLRMALTARGLTVPTYPDGDPELRAMLNVLFSAKEGRVIGWDFKTLAQVGHHLNEKRPRQLLAFGYALRQYNRSSQIESEDGTGKWSKKTERIAARLRRYDADLLPDGQLLPVMEFLFPEVASQVAAYLGRASKAGS
jgi:Family of unknown function (DUF6035)